MTNRGRSRLFALGVLIIAALAVIVLGGRSGALRPLITAAMAPLSPVAGLLNQGTEAASNLGEEPVDYATLQERNRELERIVAEMQVEIVRLRELEQDYHRLSDLVDYADEHPDQNLVTARVVALDTSSYLRWVIVNRGTRDGVQVGNPVINETGLVGRVESAAANAAWVRLAIDPGSTINAMLQTARVEGTVTGQLQGGLRMELIPQEAVVETGDLALTSGLGGSFPPNIVIGQVSSVRRLQGELFQEAEVRPTVDFDHLEIVSIITDFQPIDLSVFNDEIQGAQEGTP
jgi:rod shape-determining protein MreC